MSYTDYRIELPAYVTGLGKRYLVTVSISRDQLELGMSMNTQVGSEQGWRAKTSARSRYAKAYN